MNYKKSIIIIILAIFLISIAAVSASDVNDTAIASEDTGEIDLSTNNVETDDLKTSPEDTPLTQTGNEEILSEPDDGSFHALQNKITNANPGETITLENNYTCEDNFINEVGNYGIIISKSLTIDGQGYTIDAQQKSRIFVVMSTANVTIKNITFVNGNTYGGGAVEWHGDSGTLTDCNFIGNTATADCGGAVYWFGDSGTLTDCNFTANTATVNGGAVYWKGESGTLTNCIFIGNTATADGGGAVCFASEGGNLVNCNFTNNKADLGGALLLNGLNGHLTRCNFINNNATQGGGALYWNGLYGNVTGCNFTNNKADLGGAVYRWQNYGTLANCNFIGNNATDGGTVYVDNEYGWGKSVVVSNCNFTNNNATNYGGAVYWKGESGTLRDCVFTNNSATQNGGAIYFDEGITARTINCNFTNNSASYAGAIFMSSGSVENCIFIDNFANRGGAILSNNLLGVTADTCIFKTDSDTALNTTKLPPTLNVDNFITFYNSGEKLIFNLKTNSNITVNNGNISISVYFKNNNSWVGNYSCLSGQGWNVDLPIGSYYAIFDTEYAEFKPINRTITINKAKTELTANKVTATYNTNKNLVVTLTDINGNPLGGLPLTVKITGSKTYTTDKNGQVKVNVGKLVPKTYNVKITFGENAKYLASSANVKVTVKKAVSKITAKKKTFKKSSKVKKYTVVLKSGKTPIKKAKLTLKIKGKTYKVKTNKKGKATFKIKLTKKGKYKATIKYKGNKYFKATTKKVKIIIK